jgi:hypothetical protein
MTLDSAPLPGSSVGSPTSRSWTPPGAPRWQAVVAGGEDEVVQCLEWGDEPRAGVHVPQWATDASPRSTIWWWTWRRRPQHLVPVLLHACVLFFSCSSLPWPSFGARGIPSRPPWLAATSMWSPKARSDRRQRAQSELQAALVGKQKPCTTRKTETFVDPNNFRRLEEKPTEIKQFSSVNSNQRNLP